MNDKYEVMVMEDGILCFHTRETAHYFVERVRNLETGESITFSRLDKTQIIC